MRRLVAVLALLAGASPLWATDRREDVESWSPGPADVTGWPATPPAEAPALPEPPRAEGIDAGLAAGPAVSLFWFDPQEALPGGHEAMEQEVASIFRAMGVRVTWTRGGLGTLYGQAQVPEIPVILLARDPAPTRRNQRVMGLVIRDQEPRRAIWLFLDNVQWTLGQRPGRMGLSKRETVELGRALARVVAHEVVHAIAPEEPHAQAGLMHHSLNRGFLTGQRAPIDPQCASAFLTRLAALLPPMVPPAPAAALRTLPVGAP